MELLPLRLLLLLLLRLVVSAQTSSPATALFVLGDSTASCAATTLPLNLSSFSSSGKCLFPSAHRLLPDLIGFDEVRKACCGLGPFGGTMGCLTKEMVCPTPQRHVWWDLYSPTEAATNFLANWSWSALPNSNTSICRSVNLEMLAGRIIRFFS
uniref:Uncharacterized protein n=1 Tax=Oryza brachyantha TaxID=4533 RepID=J3NB09_ORYBR